MQRTKGSIHELLNVSSNSILLVFCNVEFCQPVLSLKLCLVAKETSTIIGQSCLFLIDVFDTVA